MTDQRYPKGAQPRAGPAAPRRCAAVAAVLWLSALAGCDSNYGQPPPPTPMPAPAPQAAAAPPKPRLPPAQTGVASYYAKSFAGKTTASGEPHRPRSMTAASRTLPLGTRARVTNTETGQSVSVRVNDRGPYAKNRILDVSPKAAEHLGMKEDGVAHVRVQPLSTPSMTQAAR